MNLISAKRFRLVGLVLATIALGRIPASCWAGGGPENVFLVVNPTSADSLAVANHYIDLRNVPAQNVFYLPWKRSKAGTSGALFREEILKPILEELNRRQLGGQVDYIVYSADYPWRVNFAEDFPGQEFQRAIKPTASLTGSTYLWSFVINKRKEMFDLTTNFYYSPDRNGLVLSRAFHSHYYWEPQGRPTTEKKGLPYLLCTMLGVTNGRGNTVDEIVHYLASAKNADGTKPKGTIYYVRNNTPRSTPRHDHYPQAVAALALLGVHAEIDQGDFIRNKSQVMGVTCGAPQLNIAQSGCRFMPGALCDNFTSAGGNLIIRPGGRPQQTPLSEALRFGAAGANGTVIEPMAIAQKFPSAFLHVHYARGCSMAESYYQSIFGPYQQLIVGDPLCQPWADAPEVTVAGIEDKPRISGVITLTPTANTDQGPPVGKFDLYVDGVRQQRAPAGGKFSLDTTALADGSHELRVIATVASPIETQGRWIKEVVVKNGMDAMQMTVDQNMLTKGVENFTVNVVSSRKSAVTITHNGRIVATVPNGNGTARLAVATLGSGPVTLHATAEGTPELRASPLRVVIP